jgi:hypothetical protein
MNFIIMFGVIYELDLKCSKHKFYPTADKWLFPILNFLYIGIDIKNRRPP